MPAQRAASDRISIHMFDVIGQDSTTEAEFIRHVALAAETTDLADGTSFSRAVHMGPPLERHPSLGPISSVGTTAITVNEERLIQAFVDEAFDEIEAAQAGPRAQYVIAPHVDEHRPRGATVSFRRYNCAGFVIEAYREIGINLLRTEPDSLPLVDLPTLVRQYPDLSRLLQNPRVRQDHGIPGDGPWPVVLAGYVMNALDRPETAIRGGSYQPARGDEFFPSSHP